MIKNIDTVKLTREQFMAVYHAADLLTEITEKEASMKIPYTNGQTITDVTYDLWALYNAAGGPGRRLDSNE